MEKITKFWNGAKEKKCRPRKTLPNEYLDAKLGVYTTDKFPGDVLSMCNFGMRRRSREAPVGALGARASVAAEGASAAAKAGWSV